MKQGRSVSIPTHVPSPSPTISTISIPWEVRKAIRSPLPQPRTTDAAWHDPSRRLLFLFPISHSQRCPLPSPILIPSPPPRLFPFSFSFPTPNPQTPKPHHPPFLPITQVIKTPSSIHPHPPPQTPSSTKAPSAVAHQPWIPNLPRRRTSQ